MDKWSIENDPIAFAKEAAEQLVPMGVRYFEYGGMKLAFEAPLAAAVAAAGGEPLGASGLSTKDEAELERLMEESDASVDPADDPMTFPGGKLPSYKKAPRRRPQPESEE